MDDIKYVLLPQKDTSICIIASVIIGDILLYNRSTITSLYINNNNNLLEIFKTINNGINQGIELTNHNLKKILNNNYKDYNYDDNKQNNNVGTATFFTQYEFFTYLDNLKNIKTDFLAIIIIYGFGATLVKNNNKYYYIDTHGNNQLKNSVTIDKVTLQVNKSVGVIWESSLLKIINHIKANSTLIKLGEHQMSVALLIPIKQTKPPNLSMMTIDSEINNHNEEKNNYIQIIKDKIIDFNKLKNDKYNPKLSEINNDILNLLTHVQDDIIKINKLLKNKRYEPTIVELNNDILKLITYLNEKEMIEIEPKIIILQYNIYQNINLIQLTKKLNEINECINIMTDEDKILLKEYSVSIDQQIKKIIIEIDNPNLYQKKYLKYKSKYMTIRQ